MKNIIILLLIYTSQLSCVKTDSYFGKEYNEYRLSVKTPTIKENMRLTLSNETSAYWVVRNIDEKKEAVHASKSIEIIDIENENWHETDRFRKNLNDTIFEQILIHPYYINDTVYWNTPEPIYFQMTQQSFRETLNASDWKKYHEKYELSRRHLSLSEVDSILKDWGLSR